MPDPSAPVEMYMSMGEWPAEDRGFVGKTTPERRSVVRCGLHELRLLHVSGLDDGREEVIAAVFDIEHGKPPRAIRLDQLVHLVQNITSAELHEIVGRHR